MIFSPSFLVAIFHLLGTFSPFVALINVFIFLKFNDFKLFAKGKCVMSCALRIASAPFQIMISSCLLLLYNIQSKTWSCGNKRWRP